MRPELADFLDFCRLERRLAPLTCSAYERDVSACLRFLNERGTNDLALVRPPDLRAFLVEEAKRRPAIGSQARTVAALKCFFRFLVENEYLERDPAHVLRTPKKQEVIPDVLDARELSRLLHGTLVQVGKPCRRDRGVSAVTSDTIYRLGKEELPA